MHLLLGTGTRAWLLFLLAGAVGIEEPAARCQESLAFFKEHFDAAVVDNGSDIYAHLPLLRWYAQRVGSITELGVRRGNSALAWSLGLLEQLQSRNPSRRLRFRMHDLNITSGVRRAVQGMAPCKDVDFAFVKGDVLHKKTKIEEVDLLFIDTAHTYEQLKKELFTFGHKAKRYIVLHDTESFGLRDEPAYTDGAYMSLRRLRQERRKRMIDAGVPSLLAQMRTEEIAAIHEDVLRTEKHGLKPAVEEFLREKHGEWTMLEHRLRSNGLTILARLPGEWNGHVCPPLEDDISRGDVPRCTWHPSALRAHRLRWKLQHRLIDILWSKAKN
eukprot:TRINITY_DN48498_c0_g1_i1.p1 TRINITY_DN48498_c0_g1~~TRINITY_DN48498_c0_g1_i1.p1  ORF type:complete len:329 (+),score=71.57 TRINITY_DN48498_c0_g1_i1:104-1090(+)